MDTSFLITSSESHGPLINQTKLMNFPWSFQPSVHGSGAHFSDAE